MSEVQRAEEKRQPYTANLEDPIPFAHDAEVNILTSVKLGGLINEYFRQVFADYDGCRIESSNKGLGLALFFKHVTNREEGLHYGIELSTAKKTHNTTIDKIRTKDYQVRHGDRYSLTEDGEDILKPLLQFNYVNNNGKVNWGAIVSETTDNGNAFGMRPEQLTRVGGIDLNLICRVLFGKKSETSGSTVSYSVDLKGAVNAGYNFGTASQNLILWINRFDEEKLAQTYSELGLGTVSTIIR